MSWCGVDAGFGELGDERRLTTLNERVSLHDWRFEIRLHLREGDVLDREMGIGARSVHRHAAGSPPCILVLKAGDAGGILAAVIIMGHLALVHNDKFPDGVALRRVSPAKHLHHLHRHDMRRDAKRGVIRAVKYRVRPKLTLLDLTEPVAESGWCGFSAEGDLLSLSNASSLCAEK